MSMYERESTAQRKDSMTVMELAHVETRPSFAIFHSIRNGSGRTHGAWMLYVMQEMDAGDYHGESGPYLSFHILTVQLIGKGVMVGVSYHEFPIVLDPLSSASL